MADPCVKMLEDERALQIVRCDCGALVGVSLSSKSVCPHCGRVLACWSDYLLVRTKNDISCIPTPSAPVAELTNRPRAAFSLVKK